MNVISKFSKLDMMPQLMFVLVEKKNPEKFLPSKLSYLDGMVAWWCSG